MKPIIMNPRIEKISPAAYEKRFSSILASLSTTTGHHSLFEGPFCHVRRLIPFTPVMLKDILSMQQQELESYIALVYKTLGSNATDLNQKLNILWFVLRSFLR